MATFNIIEFRKQTRGAVRSVANLALPAAKARFINAQNDLIDDFENHPISRELKEGAEDPNAENSSDTLSGRGNLFTFIGFEEGRDPVEEVKEVLQKGVRMDSIPIIEESGNKVKFKFRVYLPTEDVLDEASPVPWGLGKSWIKGIERGISGLGQYIYWKAKGRSGGGLQSRHKIRAISYKPMEYLSVLFRNFVSRF